MRSILATLFKFLFKFGFFKKRFFGIHKRLISPLNLFKGVVKKMNYQGFVLSLQIDDWIQENLYFLGKYEEPELDSIRPFLAPGNVFIDVGANIGLYSLTASKLVGETGRVISFEPFSQNYQSLALHVNENRLLNVKPEKIAIGETEGVLTLYYNQNEHNLGMVSTKELKQGTQEDVKVTSVDSYVLSNEISQIDVIKIDIEGFEYQALLGMKKTLNNYQPTLLIEILNSTNQNENSENIHTFLYDLGYQKYYIDDQGGLLKNEVNKNRFNYLFTKKKIEN